MQLLNCCHLCNIVEEKNNLQLYLLKNFKNCHGKMLLYLAGQCTSKIEVERPSMEITFEMLKYIFQQATCSDSNIPLAQFCYDP